MHDRPSSVPKFGVWDEKDPKSGDGFTVIFNKVKQEKQVAATKLPKVPKDPIIYPSNHKIHAKSSSRPKVIPNSIIPLCVSMKFIKRVIKLLFGKSL